MHLLLNLFDNFSIRILPAALATMTKPFSSRYTMARAINKPKLTAKQTKTKEMNAALFLNAFHDNFDDTVLKDIFFFLLTFGRRNRSKLYRREFIR